MGFKNQYYELVPEHRFLSKIDIDWSKGCWNFTGSRTGTYREYRRFWYNKHNVMAHRFSFELYKSPIPLNMTLDHLCRNKSCVNPNHLEVVTRHENARRGNNEIANNKYKTHCKRGHPFNEENTYKIKKGGRMCKTCSRERHERDKQKRLFT